MFARIVAAFAAAVVFCVSAFAADTSLLGGKASVTLPAELVRMADEAKKAKYAGVAMPQDVFSSKDDNVLFSAATQSAKSTANLDVLVSVMSRDLQKAGVVQTWGNRGTKTIGEREYGYVEFKSKGPKGDVFNHIYFTKRGNELVVFTIVSAASVLGTWGEKLNALVESTQIKG
jgi:hypothetical protein